MAQTNEFNTALEQAITSLKSAEKSIRDARTFVKIARSKRVFLPSDDIEVANVLLDLGNTLLRIHDIRFAKEVQLAENKNR